jgi:hypothetical protein
MNASKTTRTRLRKAKSNQWVNYHPLEPRNLLASFVGTEGADEVTVTFIAGIPQTIDINGEVNNNPDPTADIDLLGGNDEITFVGLGIDLTLNAADSTFSTQGSGSANGVFDFVFDNSISVTTSQFADSIDVTGAGLEGFEFNVDSGAGDDTVTYNGGYGGIDLGPGDDQVNFTVGSFDDLYVLAGDEGYDTWNFVDVRGRLEFRGIDDNGQAVFGFPCCYDGDPYGLSARYTGIENVVAPDPSTLDSSNFVFSHSDRSGNQSRGLNFAIDGRIATTTDERLSVPLTVENFNSFSAGKDFEGRAFEESRFSVLSTAYDLDISEYQRVEIGFSSEPQTGDTSGIDHALRLSSQLLVISNYLGAGSDITVNRDADSNLQISGLTSSPVTAWGNSALTLWGSNSESNHFMLEESSSRVTLYGGSADDIFDIGATQNNLDLINTRTVNVVAGEGSDRINVLDENSTGRNSYRLRDRWVFHSPDSRGTASRDFSGLWYIQTERLDVQGNEDPNIFRVSPSDDVSYRVHGNGVESGDGDKILLVGNVPDHSLIFDASTYYFGTPEEGAPLPIRYTGMEQVAEHDIFVVAKTPAQESSVIKVFDAASRKTLKVFQPYNQGFFGGVSATTGYLLPGATPAIATVPTSNGFSRVKIFDALSGIEQSGFTVFGLQHGGFDIATGNVQGDSRYEIIVSQLTSNSTNFQNRIEVWEQVESDGETTWQLNREISPFPSAPEIGTRIEVNGDFNFDGYDDIVAGAGPGWLPQVAVYDVNGETQQLHRFLVHDASYRGGVHVAAGNLLGNRKTDIAVSFAPDNSQPEPNLIRVFRGERMLRNSGGTILAADLQVTPFDGTSAVSMTIRDIDLDQRADRVFTAISEENTSGRVNIFDSRFDQFDSFFAGDDFLVGANLG